MECRRCVGEGLGGWGWAGAGIRELLSRALGVHKRGWVGVGGIEGVGEEQGFGFGTRQALKATGARGRGRSRSAQPRTVPCYPALGLTWVWLLVDHGFDRGLTGV